MAGRREYPPEAPEGPGSKDAEARMELSMSAPTLLTAGPSPEPEKGDRKEGRHKPEGRPNSEAWRLCPLTEGPPSERNRQAAGD